VFRATVCPSSGADDCVMLSPRVGMCRGCRKAVKSGWQVVRPWMGSFHNWPFADLVGEGFVVVFV
jgi:hypothetical protein